MDKKLLAVERFLSAEWSESVRLRPLPSKYGKHPNIAILTSDDEGMLLEYLYARDLDDGAYDGPHQQQLRAAMCYWDDTSGLIVLRPNLYDSIGWFNYVLYHIDEETGEVRHQEHYFNGGLICHQGGGEVFGIKTSKKNWGWHS
jgi:hypothetical protein